MIPRYVHYRLLRRPQKILSVIYKGQIHGISSTTARNEPRTVSIATLLNEQKSEETPDDDGNGQMSSTSEGAPEIVTVSGWIRSNRSMKTCSFLHIADGSTIHPLQAVIPKKDVDDATMKGLTTGACIQITGEWRPSLGSKQQVQAKELHYHSLKLLGSSDPETYPLQKKYHTPEFLRSLPHLRSRLASQTAVLQFRSWVTSRIVNFFSGRDFVQVHPPMITSSDCESAGEVFTVSSSPPTAESELAEPPIPQPKDDEENTHFFRTRKYLTVSTQLHLEAFVHAIPRVWTLSPCFRAEASDTNRHLSEFYMLEGEIAFTKSLEDIMSLVENLTRDIAGGLASSRVGAEIAEIYRTRLAEERKRQGGGGGRGGGGGEIAVPEGGLQARWSSLTPDRRWTRMPYTEAIAHLSAAVDAGKVKFMFPPVWGNALQAEHEKYLATTFGNAGEGEGGPVFVTDYPRTIKPFYMLPSSSEEGRETVACFDLLLPHVGELVGGSLREDSYDALMKAMRENGLNGEEDMRWYAELRKWGSTSHGGFGMGFDRLLAYLAGIADVREVVGFPRWAGRCDC